MLSAPHAGWTWSVGQLKGGEQKGLANHVVTHACHNKSAWVTCFDAPSMLMLREGLAPGQNYVLGEG